MLAVGRRDAPSFGEETWLSQKNGGVTAEVNIEEPARQRQFTGNIPAFEVSWYDSAPASAEYYCTKLKCVSM